MKMETEIVKKEDIVAISYPLPQDIALLKYYGDFNQCMRLIEKRMKEDIPQALKKRLRLEVYQIENLKADFTVTQEEALEILQKNVKDFKKEELDQLREDNVVEWIYVNGKVMYIDSFYSNLVKIRKDIADRQLVDKKKEEQTQTDAQILNDVIQKMKNNRQVRVKMKIKVSVDLHEDLSAKDGELHMYLPFPIEKYQIENVKLESLIPLEGVISPNEAEQRCVVLSGEPATLKHCEMIYSFENVQKYVKLDPQLVKCMDKARCEGNTNNENKTEYEKEDLAESFPHIAFTPYMRDLAQEVAQGETNPLLLARKFYDFVTTKITYSYMRSYAGLPNIPEYCASRMRGDCGVLALTFITLCRIAGIPAKWQSGLYADFRSADCHDWAMFYIEPYGWLFADCSFGGSAYRNGDMERWDFYFGNLDPYRICLAQKFQGEFNPPMKYMRWDPYDNQCGEMEFSDRPVERKSWSEKREVLSFDEIVS